MRKRQTNNVSGYPGVRWDKRIGKWCVRAGLKRKRPFLGIYNNMIDAVRTRRKWDEERALELKKVITIELKRQYPRIFLSQDKFAIVNRCDYKYLMQWKWSYGSLGYAFRTKDCIRTVMHRVILERMGYKDFAETDHINRDKLDNRRKNLRPATRQQNMWNKGLQRNNTSGYIGVQRSGNKWTANVTEGGKMKRLGSFDDPKEAAHIRDEFVKKHYGEFATLNEELTL